MNDRAPEPTFLFTDLEGSTRLWETVPAAMKVALERHDAILRTAVEATGGRVVKTTGDGLMAVFRSPSDCVAACLAAQLELIDEPWGETGPLRVRMGVHCGAAEERADDYFGPPVYRAARIMAAAHGGQVLLSTRTAEMVTGCLPQGAALRDLGEHRLKDLLQAEHLFQLRHASLPENFPPLATLRHRPNNLPTQTSAFLGRDAELRMLRELLDTPTVRLVTLTGPGGIGKTRLALQAAAEQTDRFEHGLYFVDLAPIRDPGAVFEAIARATDIPLESDLTPLDSVKRGLADRHVLLVLDNFEQVMVAADGVSDLLRGCDELRVLVTSREALGLRGEQLFPVPPLSLPARVAEISADDLTYYEAIHLFVERAREAKPGFTITDDNAAAVAEICVRLDGLPLALELAAARLKLFSPDDLLGRLRNRLKILRGGARDLPARQRTLRSTIEWSYDLLVTEDRTVLHLLSLFSPARVRTVEDVAARTDVLKDVDIIERLSSLVDKSLVRGANGSATSQLLMLETIREYATEMLDADPDGSHLRRRHAEYFSELAREGRDRLQGPERERALEDFASESGNLRTAWSYWVGAGDLERLHDMIDALWTVYDARGWYRAAVELTNDLLGVLSSVPSTPERAHEEIALLMSLARGLMAVSGYTEDVEKTYTRALALSEEVGGLPEQLPALRSLASFYLFRAEFEKAQAIGERLIGLAGLQGGRDLLMEGHLILGSTTAFLRNIPTGLEHLDRAVALFEPQATRSGRFHLGPHPGLVAHTTSALLLWLVGELDRADGRAARAAGLARELGHPFSLAYTLFHVGVLKLWQRKWEDVARLMDEVEDIATEHDYRIWTALSLVFTGVARSGLGREGGLGYIERGVAMYQGLVSPPVFWPLLLSVRATGYKMSDRRAEAHELIDEALEMSRHSFLYPEFALMKADLLLEDADNDGADALLAEVTEIAQELGLRTTLLRAATRLARSQRGAVAEVARLRDIYQTFSERTDWADLSEAGDLLRAAGIDVR